MARPFWKGSLSFGLVDIPVTLQPAIREHELSFTLLDRKDFSPVGNKRYNKKTGKEVPWEQVVRGYEFEPDEYVVLSDEELRRANIEATQTIDVEQFVDQAEISPIFFNTAYYLEPLKRGSKGYALLRAVLESTGKVGIGRVVLRTRQHLCAIVVRDAALVLNLLHFATELVPATELTVPEKKSSRSDVPERELAVAKQLVAGMTEKWNPTKFRDDYRDDVLKLVKAKVKSGKTRTIVEPDAAEKNRPVRSEVVDLMPLLKQSLAMRGRSAARPAVAAKRRAAPVSKKRTRKSA